MAMASAVAEMAGSMAVKAAAKARPVATVVYRRASYHDTTLDSFS